MNWDQCLPNQGAHLPKDTPMGWNQMSAKARSTKGDKLGITWEEKYTDYEAYKGMPERGRKFFNWIMNGCARIKQEIAENKRVTVWSDKIAQK